MARNRYFEDELLDYKFNKSSIIKTLRYALPHKKILITMTVLMLIMSFIALIPPMITSYLIDYVITKKGWQGLTYTNLAVILFSLWGAIILSDIIFTYFRMYFMSKVGHKIVKEMRKDAFCHLQTLAFDYFDNRPVGKILVRLTNYLDELANLYSSAVVTLIVEGAKVFLIMLWLFILNWIFALIVTVVLIPMAIILIFLRGKLEKHNRICRNKISNRTAFIAENIQGVFVSKAFNRRETNLEIYSDLNDQHNKSWMNIVKVSNCLYPLLDGFFYIGLLCVYFMAIIFATKVPNMGGLTTGSLIAFITYMGMFSGPLNNIAAVVQQLTQCFSNLERVFELMESEPTVKDKENAYDLGKIEGNVDFNNVTFSYEEGVNILENFDLHVPKGKMIALVGPTGAGKSTVVNLLSRFYEINLGNITIDGHDISEVTLHSLRNQVGVMMQDTFIFSGTIIENIRYARPDATDEECIEAAKQVYADEFICKLSNGYYTVTKEQGQRLSTGQRQLISFARVVLTNPRILILDEATSSIDTETETLIKNALDKMLVGRTSFVIAHRLSTIRKADCILYIANKGIAEAGTHDELMDKKGCYYNLVMGSKND